MIDIVEYFQKITGLKPIKEQEELLRPLVDNGIKKLLVTAARGFSKTLCCAVALLWYCEKSIEDKTPIKLMIVSPQDTMYEYVNGLFKNTGLDPYLVQHGIYKDIPVEGFELTNETKAFTKKATGRVRSNRADIIWIDECADVPEDVIKSAMGCLTGKINRLILISTCHKSGYFTARAMNPEKYDYKVLQFSGEKCPWLKQTVARAKLELTKAEYAMEVLGRAPTKEERATYPTKNIQKCIREAVTREGGSLEAGLDFGFDPCRTVLYITERNGIRRKDVYCKSWSKKAIEEIAEEIAEILDKHGVSLVKADANPAEYKGHVEKYTKIPVYYLEGRIHKELMIGQMQNKLQRGLVEIKQESVELIKQLKRHRRKRLTGDDIHDAFIMSCYEPKGDELKPIKKTAIYIGGKLIH